MTETKGADLSSTGSAVVDRVAAVSEAPAPEGFDWTTPRTMTVAEQVQAGKQKRFKDLDNTVEAANAGPAPGATLDPEFDRILQQRTEEGGAPDPVDPSENTAASPERRPWKVVVNGSTLQAQTEISLDAVAEANDPPFLFNRARSLVRVVFDENGNPFISVLNEAGVRGILERNAAYVKTRADGSEIPTFPPIEVVKDLMNLPEWYTIPPIAGIVEAPIVLADGGVVLKQGYDKKTRLFYAPTPGLIIPSISDRPGKAFRSSGHQLP